MRYCRIHNLDYFADCSGCVSEARAREVAQCVVLDTEERLHKKFSGLERHELADRITSAIGVVSVLDNKAPLGSNYLAVLDEIRARRKKVSDEALSRLGDPNQEKPKWRDVDLLLEIIDILRSEQSGS